MEDFSLFESALAEYEISKSNTSSSLDNDDNDDTDLDEDSKVCSHDDIVVENGIMICPSCGEEIKRCISCEKEWRYYSSTDGRKTSDPNRVQARKIEEKNIYKDVENLGFSESIISKADEIYSSVTKGQIYRGNSRKAIIFACVFQAYKLSGKHQTPENLIKLFGLNRKNGLRGMKIVIVNMPKDSEIHSTFITPVHLIHDIMDKFKASDKQKDEVIELYNKSKNKSSKLNRARPQSIAAALTYYWICKNKRQVTLKDFAKKVDLSELTILKNAKEVAQVLGTPDIF